MGCCGHFKKNWKFYLRLLVPVVFLPLLFLDNGYIPNTDPPAVSTKYRTLYVICVMAVFWALELLPLPVTSLMPLVLFPLLGIQAACTLICNDVSQNYTKESNMIFLGGLIIALGIEFCGLHSRVALWVMNLVGPSPIQLLLGTMVITGFLAMWISGTSCVAILIPVVVAIIDEIHESPEVLPASVIRRMSTAGVTLSPSSGSLEEEGSEPRGNRLRVPSVVSTTAAPGVSDPTHSQRSFSQSFVDPSNDTGKKPTFVVFGNAALQSPTPAERRQSLASVCPGALNTRHSINPQGDNSPVDKRLSVLSVDRGRSVSTVIKLDPAPDPPQTSQNSQLAEISNLNHEKFVQCEIEKFNKRNDIKKMFLFGMAYAANIGGTAVITGASPNKIFKEVVKDIDLSNGGKLLDMTFLTWSTLNLPAVLLNIVIAWLYLSVTYYGIPAVNKVPLLGAFNKKSKLDDRMDRWKKREVKLYLRREYENLGHMTAQELWVSGIFVLVVALWIFRDPEYLAGWGELSKWFQKAGDSTSCMLGALLLFLLPKEWSFLYKKDKEFAPLLEWKFVAGKMPWGYLLLLGSGFAIADAAWMSGLSAWMGAELELLAELSDAGILLVIIVLTSVLTEVVSSVACANILLPIALSLSVSLKLHPLYLTVPVALTCQYAFLFPIATPSNTITFAAGNFSTGEMVKTGFVLNVICIVVLYVNTITLGNLLFSYSEYTYEENGAAI